MSITLNSDIARTYNKNIVHTTHKLCETGVFNRQGLIQLIDETPDCDLYLHIGPAHGPNTDSLPPVNRSGRSGAEILDLLDTHKVWLGITNVHKRSEAYSGLIHNLVVSLKKQTKLWINRPRAMLMISSPNTITPYHCDLQEHSMWQIFGTQSTYIYPRGKQFLSHEDIDNHVLNKNVKYENYSPHLDKTAAHTNLLSGYMLAWPFMSPHRLVTGKSMSVSLQLEYMTPKIWATYLGMTITAFLRQNLRLKIITPWRPKDLHSS
ncbi:MAG: hypothetical protein ACPGVT_09945 [Maricaulaceae bacterium]